MYDAEERVAAVLTTNFAGDFAAVLAAHSLTPAAVSAVVATVHLRREWETFSELDTFNAANPGIGVYATGFRAQARHQDERLWLVTIVAEYFARGPDPDLLTTQVRMAAEAILRSVDRMNEGLVGSRILEAGGPDQSVTGELSRTAHLDGGDRYYDELLRISFPVIDQEVGLA